MELKRYQSLTDNVLYVSRGSLSTNTYIELQIRPHSTGYFVADYTDGYKYLSSTKILTRSQVIKLIRAFDALA